MTYVKELATVGVEKAHGMKFFTEVCNISEDGTNYAFRTGRLIKEGYPLPK